MNRQIVLFIVVLAVAAYGIFTYWPAVSSRLFYRPAAVKTAAQLPALPTSPEAKTAGTPEAAALPPTSEVRLVDPFVLRIAVRKKVEEPGAPGAAPPEAVKPPEPQLEGVWIDAGMKVAFISGQALIPGGKIMGWTVTSILKDSVVLQKGSTVKILKMEEK
jgi:hypothetical protein